MRCYIDKLLISKTWTVSQDGVPGMLRCIVSRFDRVQDGRLPVALVRWFQTPTCSEMLLHREAQNVHNMRNTRTGQNPDRSHVSSPLPVEGKFESCLLCAQAVVGGCQGPTSAGVLSFMLTFVLNFVLTFMLTWNLYDFHHLC